MSTPAIVAIPHEDGWRGRAVSGDGYPTWTGAKLLALIERDGLDKVIKTIITGRNYAWSILDPDRGTEREPEYAKLHAELLGKRGKVVRRYGLAYTTAEGQSHRDMWGTPENVASYEWVYVLLPDRMLIGLGGRGFVSVAYGRVQDDILAETLKYIEDGQYEE